MALLAKNKSQIVLCANRDIIVHNLGSESCSRTIVPINSAAGSASVKTDAAADSDNENNEPKGPSKLAPGQITHLAVSACGKLLAVTTYGDKLLHLYKLNGDDGSLELLSQRELVRGSSAMRFTPDTKSLLLADKTGDCYTFDCDADVGAKGKWILGHFSMILDILLTPDSKYVVEFGWERAFSELPFPPQICHNERSRRKNSHYALSEDRNHRNLLFGSSGICPFDRNNHIEHN